jgi:hypothetical protein
MESPCKTLNSPNCHWKEKSHSESMLTMCACVCSFIFGRILSKFGGNILQVTTNCMGYFNTCHVHPPYVHTVQQICSKFDVNTLPVTRSYAHVCVPIYMDGFSTYLVKTCYKSLFSQSGKYHFFQGQGIVKVVGKI